MQKIKVIIIEDDANTTANLQSNLNELNHSVIGVANNALDAIDLLNQEQPDIAIINPELRGEKNGVWVAHMINKKYRLPFVFLTDNTTLASINNAMNSKPNGYIMKPFSRVNISAALQLALQNFRAHITRKNQNPYPNIF